MQARLTTKDTKEEGYSVFGVRCETTDFTENTGKNTEEISMQRRKGTILRLRSGPGRTQREYGNRLKIRYSVFGKSVMQSCSHAVMQSLMNRAERNNIKIKELYPI
jgi:hypothetical protein